MTSLYNAAFGRVRKSQRRNWRTAGEHLGHIFHSSRKSAFGANPAITSAKWGFGENLSPVFQKITLARSQREIGVVSFPGLHAPPPDPPEQRCVRKSECTWRPEKNARFCFQPSLVRARFGCRSLHPCSGGAGGARSETFCVKTLSSVIF